MVDSAGVAVVETAGAAWAPGEGWVIDPTPALDLGTVEGGGATSFADVVDVAGLGDGRIAVADAGASEIRVFGPGGEHLATLGSEGDGPGELRGLRSVQALGGDTLVAFDGGRRLSWYLASGRFVRSRSVADVEYGGSSASLAEVVVTPGGAIVGREGRDFARGGDGVSRDTADFLAPGAPFEEARFLGRVPGAHTLRFQMQGRQAFRLQPLTSTPRWTARADTVWVASGERFEIWKLAGGDVVGLVRRAREPEPVTEDDRDRFEEATLARIPEEQHAAVAAVFEAYIYPETLPAYGDLRMDPDGHLWAERYASPGWVPGPEWDVFDPSGAYLGAVATPPGLDVLEVGGDHVLGVWRDQLDVPHVRRHRLRRSPR